jgi:hypothetical protein
MRPKRFHFFRIGTLALIFCSILNVGTPPVPNRMRRTKSRLADHVVPDPR